MNKIRTIIRLYEDQIGLKTIAVMARTSRNTVKKHITLWRSPGMSYEDFQHQSDAALHSLFCVKEEPTPTPRMEELEGRLPSIVKNLSKKGMTTFKQWQEYIHACPSGYGLTQFRISVQRYRMINNPSMRLEHRAGEPSRRNYSRRSYFEEIEQETLRPLNPIRYQIKKSLMATADMYSYVCLKEDIHYYSVPHIYIGKKLRIAYTAQIFRYMMAMT